MAFIPSIRRFQPALLAVAALSAASIAHAAPVALCAFPSSPTHDADLHVAAAVFKHLGLAYRQVDLSAELGKHATSEFAMTRLLQTRCSVFVGVPVGLTQSQFQQGVAVSAPYMTATFVKFRLAAPAAGSDGAGVAVAYKSPAQLIAAEEKDSDFDVENTTGDVINAVAAGKVGSGIVWYPSLVAYERAHSAVHFDVQPTRTNVSDWTLRFVAADAHRGLISRISTAIASLSASGALGGITSPWTLRPTAAEVDVDQQPHLQPAVYHPTADSGFRLVQVSDTEGAEHKADFAASQIVSGKKLYAADCAQCHGDAMQGRTAPALRGPGFAPATNSTMTIGGIDQYVTTNMPADKPGQLKPKEYADIMAYLLHANGYEPSGKVMTPDSASNDQSAFNSYVK